MENKLSRLLALSAVRGVALLVIATGLGLLGGGVHLWQLGGSRYFALSGLAMTVSGGLMFCLRPHGGQLFAAVFVASLVWAVWDAGLAFWPLVSRLVALSLLTLLVASVYPALCRAYGWTGLHPIANTTSFIVAVALILCAVSAFSPKNILRNPLPIAVHPLAPGELQLHWAQPAGSPAAHRFATIDQITQNNLGNLKQVWRTHLPAPAHTPMSLPLQASLNPLQIGNAIYLCGTDQAVYALNVDTGRERWRRDQLTASNVQPRFICAGLAHNPSPAQPAAARPQQKKTTAATPPPTATPCSEFLYVYLKGYGLSALDAHSGAPCRQFAQTGTFVFADAAADTAMPPLFTDDATATAGVAPLVYTPLLTRSALVINAQEFSPATLAGLNPDTGKPLWQWPTEVNPEAPPLALASGITYDTQLDLIYFSVTNRQPHALSGARTAIVALDARSGKVRWEFTPVHDDTWDYAVVAQPIIVDLPQANGALDKGLVAATRQGEVFLLDRRNGQPLSAIEALATATAQQSQAAAITSANTASARATASRAAAVTPASSSPTLASSPAAPPAQPHSSQMPSLGATHIREQDMWGIGLLDQLWCRIEYRKMHHTGPFSASTSQEVLQYPHPIAGITWSALNYDPDNHVLLIKTIRLSARVKPDDATSDGAAQRSPFVSPLGLPCQAPPYGTLSAVDLLSKTLIWQVPLGALKDEQLLNTRLRLNIPIGSPARGASLVTQAGVIFISGTRSRELRALALADGRELHRTRLPAGSPSGPMTYISPDTGVQYILVPSYAADGGLIVVAYALSNIYTGRINRAGD